MSRRPTSTQPRHFVLGSLLTALLGAGCTSTPPPSRPAVASAAPGNEAVSGAPIHGSDVRIEITTSEVEPGEPVWFRLSGLGVVAGGTVTAHLARDDGTAVPGTASAFLVAADGRTNVLETRLRVPEGAAVGRYRVVVVQEPMSPGVAFWVVHGRTRVSNSGAHQGGIEDLSVSAGGTWTFQAAGLSPGGELRAEWVSPAAEAPGGPAAGSAGAPARADTLVPLSGVGQMPSTQRFALDARGRSIGLTRLSIPVGQPDGPMRVRFTDSAGTVIERTLEVVRDVRARVEVQVLDASARRLVLRGQGWRTRAGDEGSVIALKIDRGRYRRLPGDLARMPSTGQAPRGGRVDDIWQMIVADPQGHFEVEVLLPSGRGSGPSASDPVFPLDAGVHDLHLLSGQFHPRGPEVDVSRAVALPGLRF